MVFDKTGARVRPDEGMELLLAEKMPARVCSKPACRGVAVRSVAVADEDAGVRYVVGVHLAIPRRRYGVG